MEVENKGTPPAGLVIRRMLEQDIDKITTEFFMQQNHRPRALYSEFFSQQEAGRRTVLVAQLDDGLAGFLTLLPHARNGPFKDNGVPEITDFNVFRRFQGQGIGNALLDAAEALAASKASGVCLSVGLHEGYGAAQRIYAKRGYIPDGSGIWYKGSRLALNAICFNDDDLLLYLYKDLTAG